MALTLVSIDNNATKLLFPQRGFDAKALLQTVRERELHLSYTEDSLAEALGLEPVAAYERSLRIGEFSDLAGRERFSVSAGLKAIIDQELKFSEEHAGPKFPRYTAQLQARFFDGLRSRETFAHWYQTERAENERWSNAEGRLSKDQADCTRGLS